MVGKVLRLLDLLFRQHLSQFSGGEEEYGEELTDVRIPPILASLLNDEDSAVVPDEKQAELPSSEQTILRNFFGVVTHLGPSAALLEREVQYLKELEASMRGE